MIMKSSFSILILIQDTYRIFESMIFEFIPNFNFVHNLLYSIQFKMLVPKFEQTLRFQFWIL